MKAYGEQLRLLGMNTLKSLVKWAVSVCLSIVATALLMIAVYIFDQWLKINSIVATLSLLAFTGVGAVVIYEFLFER